MRFTMGVIGLLAASPALAYDSVPAEMVFEDTMEMFSIIQFDTGYLPSVNDPIAVRFHITPQGGVVTEMEAVSHLRWPTGFLHRIEAIPNEGRFGIDTGVDIGFDININVASVYQSTIPIWNEGFTLARGVPFDTLALPDSPEWPLEVAISDTNLIDPFEFDIGIIPGVSLALQVEIYPQLSATMEGAYIETNLDGSIGVQDSETGVVDLAVPPNSPGEVLLQSKYVADYGLNFAIIIEPSATLETFIGDFQLISFPIPVDLLDNTERRDFAPAVYTHPLPALAPFDSETDLGVVDLGDIANLYVPFENIGVLGLEAFASVEGSDAFTVFPEYLYATEGNTDGVVVTFAPSEVGEDLATLVLETNDPTSPEIRIPLTGTGFDPSVIPDGPPNDDPPSINSEDAKGGGVCGCSSRPGGPSMAWLGLLGLLAVRRRR